MKIIRNLCRIVIGIVFVYSGFVKGIDPLGSAYKFTEYFNAFGMGWMNFSSLFFSLALSVIEFIIGAALLLNLRTRIASWGVMLFMGFFTVLTLILALTDPVSDCGCFGDAVILTNWQTFWKNVILLLLAWITFRNKSVYKPILRPHRQDLLLTLLITGMLTLSLYCYRHLPVIDFRPYAIGNNIKDGMRIPEGEVADQYEVTLKYKNLSSGEIHHFTEENYPWNDTVNWVYESSEEHLVKKGYTPRIHDFMIEHPEDGDITEELLNDSGYVIWAVSRQLQKVSPELQQTLNQWARYALEQGYTFYGLTSSSEEEINQFRRQHKVPYTFCTTDDTQLKTMLRSNPGLMILKDGTILGKWAGRDLPELSDLKDKTLDAYCIRSIREQAVKNLSGFFIILFLSIYLLFFSLRKRKRI